MSNLDRSAKAEMLNDADKDNGSHEKEQDDLFSIETSGCGKIASFGKQKAVFAHRSCVEMTPSASRETACSS